MSISQQLMGGRTAGVRKTVGLLQLIFLILLLFLGSGSTALGAEPVPGAAKPASSVPVSAPIAVIPVHQSVESGLEAFLRRGLLEAQEMNAYYVILEINTFGGRVDSAEAIGELIRNSPVPTIAYVKGKALSAGSYIALNAGQIAMERGSSLGAAAVVDGTGQEVESIKVISAWAGMMKSAAEQQGRDPRIAEAMVDKNAGAELTGTGRTLPKGEILTLTAEEAHKVGYAEVIVGSIDEVVQFIGGESRGLEEIKPSLAERFARFITMDSVSTVLLIIGIAGILIELFIPGFGLPGILGLLGFGLYFFGHYAAGFAGIEEISLFIAGILLLIVEIFVSSFGILGILGTICLFSGVVLAAYNTQAAALNLGIAFVVACLIAGAVIWIFRRYGVWNRFILQDRLTTEEGYVSAASRDSLIGQQGRAITPLRPAGTAEIGGTRVDVVTSGEFIPSGTHVVVTEVEGARVVVREHREEHVLR